MKKTYEKARYCSDTEYCRRVRFDALEQLMQQGRGRRGKHGVEAHEIADGTNYNKGHQFII
jgi:hypothetical protein